MEPLCCNLGKVILAQASRWIWYHTIAHDVKTLEIEESVVIASDIVLDYSIVKVYVLLISHAYRLCLDRVSRLVNQDNVTHIKSVDRITKTKANPLHSLYWHN